MACASAEGAGVGGVRENGSAGVVGGLGVVAAMLVVGVERWHCWWFGLFLLGFFVWEVLGGLDWTFCWGCLLTGPNA